jgi:hypothetical protein
MLSGHLDVHLYRQPDSGIGTFACQDAQRVTLVLSGSPRHQHGCPLEGLCRYRTLAVDDGPGEMFPYTIDVAKPSLLHPLEILLQVRAGSP